MPAHGCLRAPFGSFWVLLGPFGSFWVVVGARAERMLTVDELLQTLAQKTGLPEDTVRRAMPILSGFLKDKAPPQASGAIDQYFGGQPPVEGISSVQDAGGLATF